jgi:hypothetical protein
VCVSHFEGSSIEIKLRQCFSFSETCMYVLQRYQYFFLYPCIIIFFLENFKKGFPISLILFRFQRGEGWGGPGVPFYTPQLPPLCIISQFEGSSIKIKLGRCFSFPKNVRMYCNNINIFFSFYEKLFFLFFKYDSFFHGLRTHDNSLDLFVFYARFVDYLLNMGATG